jgi:hypothetical protein
VQALGKSQWSTPVHVVAQQQQMPWQHSLVHACEVASTCVQYGRCFNDRGVMQPPLEVLTIATLPNVPNTRGSESLLAAQVLSAITCGAQPSGGCNMMEGAMWLVDAIAVWHELPFVNTSCFVAHTLSPTVTNMNSQHCATTVAQLNMLPPTCGAQPSGGCIIGGAACGCGSLTNTGCLTDASLRQQPVLAVTSSS